MTPRIFISEEGSNTSIERSRARGYKHIEIGDGVSEVTPVLMRTDGSTLHIEKTQLSEEQDKEQLPFTFACKEFGLVGYTSNRFKSKISVIFCDNGEMLVTLWQGAIVVNFEDQLMYPTRNCEQVPKVYREDIKWVDAEQLLSFMKYFELLGEFPYDVEFMLSIGGSGGSLGVTHLKEESIDMSLGHIADKLAKIEKARQLQEYREQAKQMQKAIESRSTFFEPEEEEEDWDEDDWDEDEDEDWDEDED